MLIPELEEFRKLLAAAKKVVVLTGAGVKARGWHENLVFSGAGT